MPTIPASKLVPGVTETEDFLVYLVASSRPEMEPHRVDLQKYNANGQCDCEDFRFNKNVQLLKRAMPCEALECKHIKRAKRYLMFTVLNRIISDREKQAHANKKAAQIGHMGHNVSGATRQANPASPTGTPRPARWSQGPTPFKKPTAAITGPANDDPEAPF